MECGPCDKTTSIPSAGVGMMVQDNIIMFKAEKKTEAFKKVVEAGRAGKLCIDSGFYQKAFQQRKSILYNNTYG